MALDLVLYRRRNYRFTSKSRTACSFHAPVVYAIGVFKVVARQRRNTCSFCVIIRVEHFGRAALFSLPRIWALVPISFQFWKQVCCPFRSVVGSWSIILSFRKKKKRNRTGVKYMLQDTDVPCPRPRTNIRTQSFS